MLQVEKDHVLSNAVDHRNSEGSALATLNVVLRCVATLVVSHVYFPSSFQ